MGISYFVNNLKFSVGARFVSSKKNFTLCTRWQRDGRVEESWYHRLTIGWSWYHTPNGLEALALDAIVTVESQPEISRLRRDLWGEIRATEVTKEIGVAVLTVTYLKEIVTAVGALLELELVSKVELQQHALLSWNERSVTLPLKNVFQNLAVFVFVEDVPREKSRYCIFLFSTDVLRW